MTAMYIILDIGRYLCYLFGMLIVMRSVISWFSLKSTNVLLVYLTRVTEPLLVPVRHIVPRTGMVDFSPVVVILLLWLFSGLLGLFY